MQYFSRLEKAEALRTANQQLESKRWEAIGRRLSHWHSSSSCRQQDILGDFAGRELCAIHGEALLLHCLAAARVDFGDGFQLLHAVHAVETFLAKLRDRGCNFHVLWFADHECLLDGPDEFLALADEGTTTFSKHRLARAVVARHLQRYSDAASSDGHRKQFCFSFPSLDSGEFREYLAQHPVRLFFVSDGQAVSGGQPARGTAITAMFWTVMLFLKTRGYTLALIDDVEFQSSEVRSSLFVAADSHDVPFKDWSFPLPLNAYYVEQHSSTRPACCLQRTLEKLSTGSAAQPLSARDVVSIAALANLLKVDATQEMKKRVAAFAVHLAILKQCPLSLRSVDTCPPATTRERNFNALFLNTFSEAVLSILDQWPSPDVPAAALVWDVYDLVDGRIFLLALRNLHNVEMLPSDLLPSLTGIVSAVSELSNESIIDCIPGLFKEASEASLAMKPVAIRTDVANTNAAPRPLLPFSHPDFDPFLESVAVRTDAGPADSSPFLQKVSREQTHWHSTRRLAAPSISFKSWSAAMALKRNQRFMAEIIAYAASLANVSGKLIEPETLVVTTAATATATTAVGSAQQISTSRAPDRKTTKKKKTQVSQREILQKSQQAKLESEARAKWARSFENFNKEAAYIKRYALVTKYLAGLSKSERAVVGPDVLLLLCSILGQVLRKDASSLDIEPEIMAIMWLRLQEITKLAVAESGQQLVSRLAKALSLSISPFSYGPSPTLPPRPCPLLSEPTTLALLASLKTAKRATLPLAATTEFQLEHCGPYLERGFDSQPDARVSSFSPDAWQRRVLDAIDARRSLFVAAPTSAGKTFISFYAMKQVLRGDDDGVLVYVAPTKALVNQVAAEIQARYSKAYPHHGRCVWAIASRDYRINSATGCQVLVTVPHMLQIMLLSAGSRGRGSGSGVDRKSPWPSRLRWIIFDEVHCIGQSDEGIVWEQLLLMAPCPLIALSATVGNLFDFRDWLQASEQSKGRELQMIVHSSRYSDLRCYSWRPSADGFQFDGFKAPSRWPIPGLEADGCNADDPFTFTHPAASIVDRSRDTLHDISFEPRDCLTLWRSMKKHQTKEFPLDPALDPAAFLPKTMAKADVVKWEARLKETLLVWLHDRSSPFLAVRSELSPKVESQKLDEKYGAGKMLELLRDLHRRASLPALVFIYDRTECEVSLRTVVNDLKAAEQRWKRSSSEWAKKMSDFDKHKTMAAKARSRREKEPKKGKGGRRRRDGGDDDDGGGLSKAESMREAASQAPSIWDSFDPEAVLPAFSLADHTKLTNAELEEQIKGLEYANIRGFIIDGLRRGIAVHHAGMNRRYRQLVEMLFRRGFLTAVVATGTLALGINMPCKTVIFPGNSTYLNALGFRQASGRAGRRGFDILGNVVFCNFPHQRMLELMSSRLPDLRGHFPISTSLVLRTCSLLHQTDRCAFAQETVRSLLAQTRIYLGGPAGQDAIKHHLRFSIEYLRRNHLLSEAGTPLNFASIVERLYFTENSAFAFHSLLKDGYFHRLCANIHSDETGVLNELILVLSHIFCRFPCRQYKDQLWLDTIVRPSSSVVLLPPLPAEAERILCAHNSGTLAVFQAYVHSYIRQHLADVPDDSLPFTRERVRPLLEGMDGKVAHPTAIFPGFAGRSRTADLVSPFSALSGFDDTFASVEELCSMVRSGVFLEASSVPHLAIYPRDTGGVPFNAYIYDFFRHGDLSSLIKGNGISESNVWFSLQDFSLVLATIITSLANFIDPRTMGEDGNDDNDNGSDESSPQEFHADGGDGYFSAAFAATVTPAPATSMKSKREVVADSWEDEADESDGEKPSLASKFAASTQSMSSALTPAWNSESEEVLRLVHFAFMKAREQFDEKFRKIWA